MLMGFISMSKIVLEHSHSEFILSLQPFKCRLKRSRRLQHWKYANIFFTLKIIRFTFCMTQRNRRDSTESSVRPARSFYFLSPFPCSIVLKGKNGWDCLRSLILFPVLLGDVVEVFMDVCVSWCVPLPLWSAWKVSSHVSPWRYFSKPSRKAPWESNESTLDGFLVFILVLA